MFDGDTSPRFMTIAAPLRMSLTCSSRNVVNAVMVVLLFGNLPSCRSGATGNGHERGHCLTMFFAVMVAAT